MKALHTLLVLLAAGASAPALADTYNFSFIGAGGTTLGAGQLTTDGSVNRLTTTTCTSTCYGSTVVSMTGSFLGNSLTIVTNPFAPNSFQSGNYIGNNQLILSGSSARLDEYGLVVQSSSRGTGNLFGSEYPVSGTSYYAAFFGITGNTSRYYGTFAATAAGATTTVSGGTQTAPVSLGANVTNIGSQIGPTDPQQFYSFDWGGGLFSSTASITGAAANDTFNFLLFGNNTSLQTQINSANYFVGTLSSYLAAGRYTIGLLGLVPTNLTALSAGDGELSVLSGTEDISATSNFSIAFAAPVNAAAVPEPASWAMMVAGFGAVGMGLRRRREVSAPLALG